MKIVKLRTSFQILCYTCCKSLPADFEQKKNKTNALNRIVKKANVSNTLKF